MRAAGLKPLAAARSSGHRGLFRGHRAPKVVFKRLAQRARRGSGYLHLNDEPCPGLADVGRRVVHCERRFNGAGYGLGGEAQPQARHGLHALAKPRRDEEARARHCAHALVRFYRANAHRAGVPEVRRQVAEALRQIPWHVHALPATLRGLPRLVAARARSRPLVAAVAVTLILLASTLTVTVGTASLRPPSKNGPLGPGLPKIVCDPNCNMEVRVGPEEVNEVDVAVSPSDPLNIVAAANDYAQPSGAHWVGAYWSRDGGKSWGEKLLPGYPGSREISALSGMGASGDPALAFDSHGNAYLAGIAFAVSPVPGPNPGRDSIVFVGKSADGGETYSQITVVARSFSRLTFHDKEWIAVDPVSGYVYVVWVRFNAGAVGEMVFSRSENGGLTWTIPRIMSNATTGEFQVQGAYPMVTADGILHITWVDFATHQIRYVQSTDHGTSFTPPKDIGDVVDLPNPLPNSQFRSALLPQGAVDRGYSEYQGSIYIAWNDYRNNNSDIYLIYSRDGGATWSEPRRVNKNPIDDGSDQFMPDIAVTEQGYVVMLWYDRRDDPNNTLLRPYFAISTDGGGNWTELAVGPQFDGNNGGTSFLSGENHLIGDYIGISTSPTIAYMTWADTRNGSPSAKNSDIYGARVQFA